MDKEFFLVVELKKLKEQNKDDSSFTKLKSLLNATESASKLSIKEITETIRNKTQNLLLVDDVSFVDEHLKKLYTKTIQTYAENKINVNTELLIKNYKHSAVWVNTLANKKLIDSVCAQYKDKINPDLVIGFFYALLHTCSAMNIIKPYASRQDIYFEFEAYIDLLDKYNIIDKSKLKKNEAKKIYFLLLRYLLNCNYIIQKDPTVFNPPVKLQESDVEDFLYEEACETFFEEMQQSKLINITLTSNIKLDKFSDPKIELVRPLVLTSKSGEKYNYTANMHNSRSCTKKSKLQLKKQSINTTAIETKNGILQSLDLQTIEQWGAIRKYPHDNHESLWIAIDKTLNWKNVNKLWKRKKQRKLALLAENDTYLIAKEVAKENIEYYTVHFYDYRGRMYCNSPLSVERTKWIRFSVQYPGRIKYTYTDEVKAHPVYQTWKKYIPKVNYVTDKILPESTSIQILQIFVELGKIQKSKLLASQLNKISIHIEEFIDAGIKMFLEDLKFIDPYDTMEHWRLKSAIVSLINGLEINLIIIRDSTASALQHMLVWLVAKKNALLYLNLNSGEYWFDPYTIIINAFLHDKDFFEKMKLLKIAPDGLNVEELKKCKYMTRKYLKNSIMIQQYNSSMRTAWYKYLKQLEIYKTRVLLQWIITIITKYDLNSEVVDEVTSQDDTKKEHLTITEVRMVMEKLNLRTLYECQQKLKKVEEEIIQLQEWFRMFWIFVEEYLTNNLFVKKMVEMFDPIDAVEINGNTYNFTLNRTEEGAMDVKFPDGNRDTMRVRILTELINEKKTRRSFAPNLIHATDAQFAGRIAIKFEILTVHDAFLIPLDQSILLTIYILEVFPMYIKNKVATPLPKDMFSMFSVL